MPDFVTISDVGNVNERWEAEETFESSDVAKRAKMNQEPITEEIALQCKDHLLGKFTMFLHGGRNWAKAGFQMRSVTTL